MPGRYSGEKSRSRDCLLHGRAGERGEQGRRRWFHLRSPAAQRAKRFCLVEMEDNEPSQKGPLVYLSVEGRMDAALAEVERNNGEVVSPKHSIGPHGFRAIIIDSEGNKIALHSHAE